MANNINYAIIKLQKNVLLQCHENKKIYHDIEGTCDFCEKIDVPTNSFAVLGENSRYIYKKICFNCFKKKENSNFFNEESAKIHFNPEFVYDGYLNIWVNVFTWEKFQINCSKKEIINLGKIDWEKEETKKYDSKEDIKIRENKDEKIQ